MLKNLVLYRLTDDVIFTRDNIQEKLQNFEFMPCGANDEIKIGWTSPIEPDGMNLFYESKGNFLFSYQVEEKKIPAETVKKELKAKVKKIEEATNKKVSSKEKLSLKDEVIRALLPRAFSSTKSHYIWFDTKNKLVAVDAGSTKKAEDILSFMRKTLGTLPVMSVMTKKTGMDVFADWILNDMVPYGFVLGGEATLASIMEQGGEIAAKNQDLQIEEIKSLINSNEKYVSKVGLVWNEHTTFVVDETFSLKKLKFGKEFFAKNDDIDHDEKLMKKMADFELMAGELSIIIPKLIESFGGEDRRG